MTTLSYRGVPGDGRLISCVCFLFLLGSHTFPVVFSEMAAEGMNTYHFILSIKSFTRRFVLFPSLLSDVGPWGDSENCALKMQSGFWMIVIIKLPLPLIWNSCFGLYLSKRQTGFVKPLSVLSSPVATSDRCLIVT